MGRTAKRDRGSEIMIVYTSITGKKDELLEQKKYPDVEYVAFLDEDKKSDIWKIEKTDNQIEDPYLRAKYYKILPHKCLKTDVSLWIDGNIRLKIDPTELFKHLADSDIVLFKHNLRQCSYMEAVVVASLGYEHYDKVEKQMVRYKKEGFPVNYGLTYNGFILRKHTPQVEDLCEFWWKEIVNNSRRDQLSFMYSCWKLGIKPKIVPIGDVHHENEVYERVLHNYESKI